MKENLFKGIKKIPQNLKITTTIGSILAVMFCAHLYGDSTKREYAINGVYYATKEYPGGGEIHFEFNKPRGNILERNIIYAFPGNRDYSLEEGRSYNLTISVPKFNSLLPSLYPEKIVKIEESKTTRKFTEKEISSLI